MCNLWCLKQQIHRRHEKGIGDIALQKSPNYKLIKALIGLYLIFIVFYDKIRKRKYWLYESLFYWFLFYNRVISYYRSVYRCVILKWSIVWLKIQMFHCCRYKIPQAETIETWFTFNKRIRKTEMKITTVKENIIKYRNTVLLTQFCFSILGIALETRS